MTAWTAIIRRRLSTRSAITPPYGASISTGTICSATTSPSACPIRSACRRASPGRSSASRCRRARCPGRRTSAGSSGSRAPRTCGARLLRGSRAGTGVRAGRVPTQALGQRLERRQRRDQRGSVVVGQLVEMAARLALRSAWMRSCSAMPAGVASTRAARRSSASACRLISPRLGERRRCGRASSG